MARPKSSEDKRSKTPPAKSPESREEQMIGYAIRLAEKQLIDGTATSQVITHFLKLGSSKERLERELLSEKKDYLKARKEQLESEKRNELLYQEAITAMRMYSGSVGDEDE